MDFLRIEGGGSNSHCPLDTQVGIAATSASFVGSWSTAPVYNLTPPPGVLLRFGFTVAVASIIVDTRLSEEPPYLPISAVRNIPELLNLVGQQDPDLGQSL